MSSISETHLVLIEVAGTAVDVGNLAIPEDRPIKADVHGHLLVPYKVNIQESS